MTALAYTNIFTENVDRLAEFYSSLFDLAENNESRTPIFRGFVTKGSSIGFNAFEAYELLGLTPLKDLGDRVFQTFDVDSDEAVRQLTARVLELGGTVVKTPFKTYYGWYQSVLRDPDGNAFRINYRGTA